MPKLYVTTRESGTQILDFGKNVSVMEIIRKAGISEILAKCDGCLSCGTCHIYIHPEDFLSLKAAEDDEISLLDCSDYKKETSRMSCQIFLSDCLGDLRVSIAPEG